MTVTCKVYTGTYNVYCFQIKHFINIFESKQKVMRNTIVLQLLLLFCHIAGAQVDSNAVLDNFKEGEYFFNRGDYQEAAYFYKLVLLHYPENSNFNFKLGACYMNIPGSEVHAIPFFEKAVKQTVSKSKYRQRDFYETNAPLHAWYYLGNVYRMNDMLDKALESYQTFVSSPFYYGNYNVSIVENEIKSCERSKIIRDSPVSIEEYALDTVINTSADEINPVISPDGQVLLFVRRLRFYDAIFVTFRRDDTWEQPVNLNPVIGSDGDYYPVYISNNASEIYFVRVTDGEGDIYVSHSTSDHSWSKAVPLNKHINSSGNETWASLTSDGQTIWFSSSRKRGRGGLDIYYSEKNANGVWTRPHNAGMAINTEFDEDCPVIANNNRTLFFSSKGHYSMGGFDIFYSEQNENTWQEPVNIGYPVNNTTDNSGFIPENLPQSGYISKMKEADYNIFQVRFKQ